MVNAWATENRLVLGQTKVTAKSNEITAIPKLLKILTIEGCLERLIRVMVALKFADTGQWEILNTYLAQSNGKVYKLLA